MNRTHGSLLNTALRKSSTSHYEKGVGGGWSFEIDGRDNIGITEEASNQGEQALNGANHPKAAHPAHHNK